MMQGCPTEYMKLELFSFCGAVKFLRLDILVWLIVGKCSKQESRRQPIALLALMADWYIIHSENSWAEQVLDFTGKRYCSALGLDL
jgi:hypothetical protein